MKAYKCSACGDARDPCYLINACDGEYDDPDKDSCPYDGRYLGRRAGHNANWKEIDVAEITTAIKGVIE